jgi:hypothetical protein
MSVFDALVDPYTQLLNTASLSDEGVLASNFIMYVLSDECCIWETATAKQPFHPRLHCSSKDDVFCPPY